ncbi:MAG: cadherin-like beta sandwich domain-containing protein [Spirochaetaceae bacterium]|jgi:hypothetical protein|nr:cadherin-like beta sandwich domain-containing protein [Spirochaetaceae bacterium]
MNYRAIQRFGFLFIAFIIAGCTVQGVSDDNGEPAGGSSGPVYKAAVRVNYPALGSYVFSPAAVETKGVASKTKVSITITPKEGVAISAPPTVTTTDGVTVSVSNTEDNTNMVVSWQMPPCNIIVDFAFETTAISINQLKNIDAGTNATLYPLFDPGCVLYQITTVTDAVTITPTAFYDNASLQKRIGSGNFEPLENGSSFTVSINENQSKKIYIKVIIDDGISNLVYTIYVRNTKAVQDGLSWTNDADWVVPATGCYLVKVRGAQGEKGVNSTGSDNGAGAQNGKGGYGEGKLFLEAGTTLKIIADGSGGLGGNGASGNGGLGGKGGTGGGMAAIKSEESFIIVAGGGGGGGGGGNGNAGVGGGGGGVNRNGSKGNNGSSWSSSGTGGNGGTGATVDANGGNGSVSGGGTGFAGGGDGKQKGGGGGGGNGYKNGGGGGGASKSGGGGGGGGGSGYADTMKFIPGTLQGSDNSQDGNGMVEAIWLGAFN